METVLCVDCGEGIPADEPARPVRWTFKQGRRLRPGRGFVHADCKAFGHFVSENGYCSFWEPIGGPCDLPPAPCENCGRVVVLTEDKRRRRTVCSPRCAVAVTPSHAKDDTPRACAECGGRLEGRSDREHCSPRCRQKAYRTRKRTTA